MDIRSAEFTKYAANAMLATRISFMNELALLADSVGADIELVRQGIGTDPRIGTQFLYAGAGYGGSCFPKDVKALVRTGHEYGVTLKVLSAVEAANDRQKRVLVDKVVKRFGEDLSGDNSPSGGSPSSQTPTTCAKRPGRVVIQELLKRGATIKAYDPVAMAEAQRTLGDLPGLTLVDGQAAALDSSDALIIVTEWRQFKSPDFDQIVKMLKQPVVFDGRNLYDPDAAEVYEHRISRHRPCRCGTCDHLNGRCQRNPKSRCATNRRSSPSTISSGSSAPTGEAWLSRTELARIDTAKTRHGQACSRRHSNAQRIASHRTRSGRAALRSAPMIAKCASLSSMAGQHRWHN